MSGEQSKNPEFFDQDSVMIYIDPKVMSSLNDMAEKKQEDLKALQDNLQELETLLKALDIQISGGIISEIPENIQQHIKVQGQKLSDILTQVRGLETVWAGTAAGAETIAYPQFQIAALLASKSAASTAEAQALLEQAEAQARRTEEAARARAQALLADTAIPVSLVASKVGYSNFSYFSQVFKKFSGCSPVEYRAQRRKAPAGEPEV